ncbi:flavoprotein [Saccharopolyspora sp. NPDC002686]|uniref:flavoprotein n=1 Tax=Saccharopolyspora sp. NPDC002686 TaxID=3154541 RepID=UPI00332A1C15
MRLVVGMTGATGAPLGLRLLERLAELPEVETHLVISRWARATVELETGLSAKEIGKLADVVHNPDDQGASISSGSFRTGGMRLGCATAQRPETFPCRTVLLRRSTWPTTTSGRS